MNNSIARIYMGKGFQEAICCLVLVFALQCNHCALGCQLFDNIAIRMIFGCKFLFDAHTLFEQCTYLGYFLLEAPREYVQHGPLLSIN
jgi:hypothetical protein